MGYTSTLNDTFAYQPSDDIIIYNDTQVIVGKNVTNQLVKEFTLGVKMFVLSGVRLSFEEKLNAVASGEILNVDVWHNTTQLLNANYTNNVWTTHTLDIAEAWVTGDVIQVYMSTNDKVGLQAYMRNVRLCGVLTPFYNTVES